MASGGKSTSSILGDISRRHFQCGICGDTYKDPKILDCLHTFCLQCIQDYITKTCKGSGRIPCPTCRTETQLPPDTGAHGLKTNLHIVSLMENLALQENLTSSGSEVEESPQRDPKCLKHEGEVMRFFCTTCEVLICRDCTVVAHPKPKHDYIDINQAATKYKQSLTELCIPLEEKLKEVQEGLANVSRAKLELRASVERFTTEVQNRAEELRQEVTNQEERIIHQLERVDQERRKLDENKPRSGRNN